MKGNARSRGRLITGFLIATICAAAAARPTAQTPTPQLSDNRGDTILAALESTAINTAFGLTGFFADPLTFTYPPVVVNGRVLKHPKIHNIFVDDDWDAHNPDAPGVKLQQAETLFTAGKDEEALRLVAALLEKDPSLAPAHALLASYYEKKGQSERAAEHRRQAEK